MSLRIINMECEWPLTSNSHAFRIGCFRHLEKPIKTKENKRKHFLVFICFYWFCPVFLDGESKFFKRRDAEFFFFFEHRMHGWNESSVYFVSFVFR